MAVHYYSPFFRPLRPPSCRPHRLSRLTLRACCGNNGPVSHHAATGGWGGQSVSNMDED